MTIDEILQWLRSQTQSLQKQSGGDELICQVIEGHKKTIQKGDANWNLRLWQAVKEIRDDESESEAVRGSAFRFMSGIKRCDDRPDYTLLESRDVYPVAGEKTHE